MRKQSVVLEYRVDVAPIGRQPGHVTAADQNLTAIGDLESADHTQHRRLAGAGRSEQRNEGALRHIQSHAVDGDEVAVQLRQPLELDLACHVLRSEEHTSELQSLMRISYAVFCLKKKKTTHIPYPHHQTSNNTDTKH